MLCSYKQNPNQSQVCLQKLLDILKTAGNDTVHKKYKNQLTLKDNSKSISPNSTSELSYWNIIFLSQLIVNRQLTQLVATQSMKFVYSMPLQIDIMIIYKMLALMQSSSRPLHCFQLIKTQNILVGPNQKIPRHVQIYMFLNQIIMNRVLLNLGLMEEAKIMYMMKFNQTIDLNSNSEQLLQIDAVPISIYQQLLHAQIEYNSANYNDSLKILIDCNGHAQKLAQNQQFVKNIINHNIALVLGYLKHENSSYLLLRNCLGYFHSSNKEPPVRDESNASILSCKQNMLICIVNTPQFSYNSAFELVKSLPDSFSYKINYRKAQFYLSLYRQMLKSSDKQTNYSKIIDCYETVYYYPNKPYFQQKGKNKNINFTNHKHGYRRYVIQQNYQLQKAQEALQSSQFYLKQSLTILERQKNRLVRLEGEYQHLTDPVILHLHNEYLDFKSNIYSLLCYICTCLGKCTKAIYFATEYESFQRTHCLRSKNERQQIIYYNILSYKAQCLCELNRMYRSYDTMNELTANLNPSQESNISVRSAGYRQQGTTYFASMTQLDNFYYNLAVLYCRSNKILEAYQCIQKLLLQMKLSPSDPKTKLPSYLCKLLIYYNLLTNNSQSVLQLMKYHRIVNCSLEGYAPVFSITK